MTRQKSFGEILREARMRKGMDAATAARRLRIRPDVLDAIEKADFNRMPPKGYARNMVHAYARLVGLNPTDLTSMYLDDDRAFQMNQSRGASMQSDRGVRQFEVRDRRTPSLSRSEGRRQEREESLDRFSRSGRVDRYGRSERSEGPERLLFDTKSPSARGMQQSDPMPQRQGRRSSSREEESATPRFGNLYSGPSASSFLNHSKVPFIAISAVLVVVVILLGVFVLGGGDDSNSDVNSDVTIPGIHDTSNPDTGEIDPSVIQNQQAIVITPDRVTFVYAVPAGSSAYIEVYESGKKGASVAQTVQGPSEKAFDVTETLTFVTSNPKGVIITVGNKVVEPTDENGDGVYIYEVDFDKYLAEWKAEQQAKKEQAEAAAKENATE